MQIHPIQSDEIPQVREFLSEQGWAHRVQSEANFARLIENSQRTAVAVKDNQIIGFARGITDGISNGYLSMVVVAPAYRRLGIGKALVSHVMGTNPEITWVLRTGRDGAFGFFSKLGFNHSSIAMERLRT